MLKRIKMARSTYYYNVAHPKTSDKYQTIRKRISEIFAHHHKRYGYRRICAQLRNEGYAINHKTVQKLMQEMHLKSVGVLQPMYWSVILAHKHLIANGQLM